MISPSDTTHLSNLQTEGAHPQNPPEGLSLTQTVNHLGATLENELHLHSPKQAAGHASPQSLSSIEFPEDPNEPDDLYTLDEPDRINPNHIIAVIEGAGSGRTLAEKGNKYIEAAFRYEIDSSYQLNAFLPHEKRQQLTVDSAWPIEVQHKIGLLRSPGIDESKIPSTAFSYNLSMALEARLLGTHLKNQLQVGDAPTLKTLWNACREWRVRNLDYNSSYPERSSFINTIRSESITASNLNVFYLSTPIFIHDEKYQHVLRELIKKRSNPPPFPDTSQTTSTTFEQLEEEFENETVTRVSLRQWAMINGKNVPLTQLKTVVKPDNTPVSHPWLDKNNAGKLIKSKQLADTQSRISPQGTMVHTHFSWHERLNKHIEKELQEYLSLAAKQNNGSSTRNTLIKPDLGNPQTLDLLKRAFSIHYWLCHQCPDVRGSSAKGELFTRTLCAAAGFELPPFKKGFVPDLDAFLHSHHDYIPLACNALEY